MSERMPRFDGDTLSPLEQLKELCRQDATLGDFLRSQRKEMGGKKMVRFIEEKYGIFGLSTQRVSDFWRWLEQRENTATANSAVADLRQIFSDDRATPEGLHKWILDLLTATGLQEDNIKILGFVAQEVRKIMALRDAKEKWSASQKTKVDAGLDAVLADISSDPVAVELFEQIRSRIKKEVK